MVLAQPSNESARTLRVAVVGAGERGIELAAMVPTARHGARIVAVCDPSERSRDRALRLLGGPLISAGDHTALHPDVADVAIVASPDDTHARIAIDLLRAGIAVYLEKPMATTVEDADRVLEVARATGTPLYVGHNMRHEAMPKLMKSIIDDGQIGEVKAIWCRHFVGHGGDYYFKDWHADRSRSTGLLLQKAVHDIDFMHWLAGSYAQDVTAMGALTLYGQIADRRDRSAERMSDWFSLENWPPLSQKGLNPIVDVEDLSMVLARLESGVFISYQQCHYTPDYWRNFTVIGTEGRLENSGDSGGEIRVWNRRHASAAPPDLTYEIPGDGGIGHDEADLACLVEFFGFARTRATTVTSPVGARYAVAAGVAATDSLRANSRLGTIAAVPAPLRNYFREGQQPHTREEREDMGLTS